MSGLDRLFFFLYIALKEKGMKKQIKNIIGEQKFNFFKKYYEEMGKLFPTGASHYLDLKCDVYTGTSSSINEYIGFLQPLTVELYLIDEKEFWCKFHDNRLSEQNCVQMVESVLVPNEFDKKETGYYRIWWDEYDMWEGEELVNKLHESDAFHAGAIGEMKLWLHKNWEQVDWSDLDIELVNNNTKDNPNNKHSKYFGRVSDDWAKAFSIKKEPVVNFSLVLDMSDGDMSITVNGLEFWWIPEHNIMSLYKYGHRNYNIEW